MSVRDSLPTFSPPGVVDSDPVETGEWLDAVVRASGHERALTLLRLLEEQAQRRGIVANVPPFSAYRNTVPVEDEGAYPGDLAMEERITSIVRWNALAMVVRANVAYGELGGHIGSYASAAEIFETGFNHFFRGDAEGRGDLVFFQPHSAPGVYARAYLEGRLSEMQLANYRQEVGGHGLSSYPHPWLMPEFWQFPTGSMGIGPISAIYHARFMRYLAHRGIADTANRRVWGVFGDGEMDEPESVAALTLAAREKLDNLTFVINCNLQRLDGPVRGNGQIIQELESLFSGAGWNVIKVLWGSDWDALFARDKTHSLLRAFAETLDGEYQTLGANDGKYNLERFFGRMPELRALVSHMSEAQIDALKRGGHDLRKLHAAFRAAARHEGRPTVILAKTKKGYGMGGAGESRMTVHQQKKLDVEALKKFRDRFELPLSDADVAAMKFYRPAEDSREMRYLRERRAALGGALPARRRSAETLPIPALSVYAQFALQAAGKPMSTTMAAVRLLSALLKDKTLGPRIVPIVADEARTFGMANLFRQIGIYAPEGQLYEPEDSASMLSYREARDGQLLEEGITEAGALSSWTAAATSYSVHGMPMLPFYIYYSMFGFQRVGDLIWAAADQRSRGFLLGATAGRTTLGGEGLQHQDGHSHLVASTVPNCVAYDPGFAYELALIVQHGLHRMLALQHDVFFYVTVMNQNHAQPSMPAGVETGVLRGLYLLPVAAEVALPAAHCTLVGSGAILHEVVEAARWLAEHWQVQAAVCSATSFSELAREGMACERERALGGLGDAATQPWATQVLSRTLGPIVAATDYVRAVPEQLRAWVPVGRRYVTLGTDGFGRSDSRALLREFFEVSPRHIVLRALQALADDGDLPAAAVAAARLRYGIAPGPAPWLV